MTFIEEIKDLAKLEPKTIVLPEGTDTRVLQAAKKIMQEGFAHVIILGNEKEIRVLAQENNIDLGNTIIIEPKTSCYIEDFTQKFYELRKEKGITEKQAKELMQDETHFGMMLVKEGKADGLVSGAAHSTADTLRPALQILRTAPGTKLVSTFFIMCVPDCEYGENGNFVFSDCGLVENPDAECLSEIAIASAKSFKQFLKKDAKVAMLSYSTLGSAKSELTEKVVAATRLVREKAPDIAVEGELQLDSAIIPEVAKTKAPDNKIAGYANTLVFPDLNSGNIGYKLVQKLAKAESYGPLCQGISKPVNDLSRGCSADDIVGVVAITAVQAQNKI